MILYIHYTFEWKAHFRSQIIFWCYISNKKGITIRIKYLKNNNNVYINNI